MKLDGGRYEAQKVLLSSPYTRVLLVRPRDGDGLEVMKVLRNPGLEGLERRFEREIRALMGVRHAAVIRLLSHGLLEDGSPYFTMEYHPGCRSLLEVLTAGAGAPCLATRDTMLPLLEDLCGGLTALHDAGIVHRDVKPSNILILPGDRGLWIDLGLVRRLDSKQSVLTAPGSFAGTLLYCSPEMALDAAIGPASDIYQLGLVLFHLLTGYPHSRKGADHFARLSMGRETVPDPREIRPEMAPALAHLIVKAAHTDPARRFPSARALFEALCAIPAGAWDESVSSDGSPDVEPLPDPGTERL